MENMEHTSPFTSLFIVILLAVIVPVVVSRFKKLTIPIVVGEILAGILLGRSGFRLAISEDPVLDFLAEFGLVFLMFLSGMEIDMSYLGASRMGNGRSDRLKNPVTLSILSFAITLVMAGAVGWLLFGMGLVQNPWMMGLILSTTSLGVVVPVLKEQGLIGGRYGQTLLLAALIADFATMLLITIQVAIISSGLTFDALLIMLLFVAFFVIYQFGEMFFNRIPVVRIIMEELSHATARIKIRIAIAMMLLFVVLAEVLGAEVILGAFLAGVIVSLLRTSDDAHVTHELETIGYGFIIPIFFIKVGVDLNFSALFESSSAMLLIPLLVAAAFLLKLVASSVFLFAFDRKQTLAGGILLSSRLSLIIAAVAIGNRLGVISEAVNAATIVVAVITVTLSPMIFARLMPRREQEFQRFIMVGGASELGLQVAEELKSHNEQVLVITAEDERIDRALGLGFEVLPEDFEKLDGKVSEYLSRTESLIATFSDVDRNYALCQRGQSVGIQNIVAYVSEPTDVDRFKRLGVRTLNSALNRASMLSLLARNPGTYELLTRTDDDKEIIEITIVNERCVSKRLGDLVLPGDALLVSVRRNGELLIPHGNTRFERGDRLTLVGSLECIDATRQMFMGACE